MMSDSMVLLSTAILLGLFHTFIGVDHYVPFVVLSKANAWSMRKTLWIVLACGIGHVLSSTVFGFIGIALSQSVSLLVDIESIRGSLATYFMIAFGLVYTLWALRSIYLNKPHKHHVDGHEIMHDHHAIESAETHIQEKPKSHQNVIWGLFILFVLGPCEPLIPLLMYPAATENTSALIGVTLAFSICTISMMLLLTWVGIKGLNLFKVQILEKYSHALAGSAITMCGLMILSLGI